MSTFSLSIIWLINKLYIYIYKLLHPKFFFILLSIYYSVKIIFLFAARFILAAKILCLLLHQTLKALKVYVHLSIYKYIYVENFRFVVYNGWIKYKFKLYNIIIINYSLHSFVGAKKIVPSIGVCVFVLCCVDTRTISCVVIVKLEREIWINLFKMFKNVWKHTVFSFNI